MIAALSFATNGFASAPTTPDSCPPESMDLLVYLNAQSSAVDFMTNVLHMADLTTPAATVMAEMMTNFKPIGSHTQHICEATDILYADPAMDPVDGQSGDVNYPYGDIKVLLTVGEYLPSNGYMLVGVPDGMGAMLKDDSTVRIVFQSESYGPMYHESYPFIVNPDGASFTGSHVMYVDCDRDSLAEFMSNGRSAEGMVKDAGNLIESVYNLKARRSASTLRLARHASHRWVASFSSSHHTHISDTPQAYLLRPAAATQGNLVEQRSKDGCTTHPHYSNTDPEGCGMWENIMNTGTPTDADWLMQSLCSAHLEEKHQWGEGIGVEDDLFITNEEWTRFVTGSNYTGIPAHVIDIATKASYAAGVFTLGGFEKIVEVNCGHPDYVCFSPSGYNGAFSVDGTSEAARKNAMGKRPDGTDYVFPQNVCPARLYIGKKGYNAKGEPATDFLSRNGLAYGHLYGFATNQAGAAYDASNSDSGRDGWHKTEGRANGDTVSGAFYPIDWQWDGEVKTFMYDGSWSFQHKPDSTDSTIEFWNPYGNDGTGGKKTEHNSPDPYGGARFMQTSTAGYFGIYDFAGIDLSSGFPEKIPSTYTNLQGEVDITAQIELGGKGMKANGEPQLTNSDKYSVADDGTISDSAKVTFEDIDGFEWLASSDNANGYVVIQEDSGNDFGERTFISKVEIGTPLTYYFIAMSGGDDNTRMKNYVAVPAGSAGSPNGHEFSGVIDLSGMLAKDSSGNYMASAGDGQSKRAAEAMVPIDEKIIAMGLQAHSINKGVISALRGDRGGQIYAYLPSPDVRYGTRRRLTQKSRLTTNELAHKAHKLSAEELQLGEAEDKLDEVAFLTRKN